jgi:preprotein translocase subunit YajC
VARNTRTRLAAVPCTDFTHTFGMLAVTGARRANRKASIVISAASGQSSGSGLYIYLLMALIFVGFYFFAIRPQQKRRRETESMQRAAGPGDEIVTVGGLYGTIIEIDDETALLEIAPDVHARYARAAIGKVINRAEQVEEIEDEEVYDETAELDESDDVVEEDTPAPVDAVSDTDKKTR